MSVADSFQFPGKFPVCVPVGAAVADDMKIVDLELADAMRIFWALESVTLSIQLMGHDSGGGGATILEANNAEIPAAESPVLAPRSRCCLSNLSEEDEGILAPAFAATPLLLPDALSTPGVGGSTIMSDFTIDSIYFTTDIYEQDDGLYTIVFWRDPSLSTASFYISGSDSPISGFSYTGISGEQDMTDAHPELTSGRIQYFMHKISGDPLFEADSANFSLQLNFFSFS